MGALPKKTFDEWLDEVDYEAFNKSNYTPSVFAAKFVEFIKMVNGPLGESDPTPPIHYAMLDNIAGTKKRTVNVCARGLAKTTLFCEYLILYLAVFGEIDGFGKVPCMIYVANSMDKGVKNARKNIESRYNNSEFLQQFITSADFTENYLRFENEKGVVFEVSMYGAQTTPRGIKMSGNRPVLAVMDDLMSDKDGLSKVSMERINDTVYKAIEPAMDPKKKKIILCGTPFNKEDILVKAVESGAWHVNMYPVAQKLPCKKEDFHGAWEKRFTWEAMQDLYDFYAASGNIDAFMQEYMLRITSEEDRLVKKDEIQWYLRKDILGRLHNYNIYITTDFAYSEDQKSDFSVIAVWAYSNNGDFFFIDGMCSQKCPITESLDVLFKMVEDYKPQSVGVEISGQQSILIPWIKKMMLEKGKHFNLAMHKGKSGIRPEINKLKRFQLTVPWFKQGKVHFPKEHEDSPIIKEFMSEISLATMSGLKGKDDCLDTISMLTYLNLVKPDGIESEREADKYFGIPEETHMSNSGNSRIKSYLA